MGRAQNCSCCNTSSSLLFLLLLSISFYHVSFMAQGRTIPKKMVGSRPPRCERRCGSCHQCEAVQVPVLHISSAASSSKSETAAVYLRRGDVDERSNYKPISWKCKCGDLFFNP